MPTLPMPFLRVILIICSLMLGWGAVRAEPGTLAHLVGQLVHTSG